MRDLFAMCFGALIVTTIAYVAMNRAGSAVFHAVAACVSLVAWLAFYLADRRK